MARTPQNDIYFKEGKVAGRGRLAGYNEDLFVERWVEVVLHGLCPADEGPIGLISRFFLHQNDYRVRLAEPVLVHKFFALCIEQD